MGFNSGFKGLNYIILCVAICFDQLYLCWWWTV